jgi:uncharacterized membrane protein (DUF4010 family)
MPIYLEALGPIAPFLVSLAIGLLIGLERERNPGAKAGLRTFSLVALAGTLCAMLSSLSGAPWLLGAGLLVLGGMMVAVHARDDEDDDPGTTTVAAVVVCYGLGALAWHGQAQLAITLAILTTVLLYFKAELRGVSQNLTRTDLVSILQFAVLSLVILPFLPDIDYGPYDTLNPYQTWLMVVLISGLSLAGYAALRFAGQRHGALLTGLLGGIASSTATTLVFARHTRADPRLAGVAAIVILVANWVVLIRLTIVVAVLAPAMLGLMASLFAGGALAGLAYFHWLWRQVGRRPELPELEMKNPTELRAALGFGVLYALVLLVAAWLSDIAGHAGMYAVALASGLTDVDAITLSSLRLRASGALAAEQAATAICLAIGANIVFKSILATSIGGRDLARRILPGLAAVLLGIATTYLIVVARA